MIEKRVAPRLEEGVDVIVTVISGGKNLPKEKIMYNYIRDFSATGVSIQTNIFLPVGTLLNIKFTLKTLKEKINAVGKVRWVNIIHENKYYETGVEFINAPVYTVQMLEDYILWRKKNEKPKSALGILINKHFLQE